MNKEGKSRIIDIAEYFLKLLPCDEYIALEKFLQCNNCLTIIKDNEHIFRS